MSDRKESQRAEQVLKKLKKAYPKVESALEYQSPFELLISTILSAQCTDKRVNIITKTLFKKYKKPKDYLKVSNSELEKDIYSTGFYRQKTRSIKKCCSILIEKYNGKAVIERVGHSFIKDTMRKVNAIFACEHSAHYYFKHNFNADSGLIASLIVSEIICKQKKPLSKLLKEFEVYHKIEETNFKIKDKNKKLKEIERRYKGKKPKKIMTMDGVSVEFDDYWFNVRPSNTEPLLRLNLEAKSRKLMESKKREVSKVIMG